MENNQNFVNYYIDTLISTMTDAIVRNVSLQANAKIANEVIEEKNKKISEFESAEKQKLSELEKQLTEYKATVNSLVIMKNEYESTKHQIQHLQTFKTQLLECQKSLIEKDNLIGELESKIELLENGGKKKKVVPKVTVVEETQAELKVETKPVKQQVLSLTDLVKKDKKKPAAQKETKQESNEEFEDGGSF